MNNTDFTAAIQKFHGLGFQMGNPVAIFMLYLWIRSCKEEFTKEQAFYLKTILESFETDDKVEINGSDGMWVARNLTEEGDRNACVN